MFAILWISCLPMPLLVHEYDPRLVIRIQEKHESARDSRFDLQGSLPLLAVYVIYSICSPDLRLMKSILYIQ